MSSTRAGFAVALLALTGVLVLLFMEPWTLLLAYLAAAVTVTAIAAGALGVLMLSYLVRGAWTEGLHIPLTAAALMIPFSAVLFVPVLIAVPWIYPWSHEPAGSPGSFKAIYLTAWFFAGRTVLYFITWTVLALWVRSAWAHPRRMIASASAGLIVYALTVSFAGVDWLESLTPEFHSSIYGLLFATHAVLGGFAVALVIALSQRDAPTFRYGAILLSALLLWAYNHAMQYIIVWSGNIPEEANWYIARETGIWGALLWGLIALQFIVPFFALLSERVRNTPRPLLAIAGGTVGLRFLETIVLIGPQARVNSAILLLTDLAVSVVVAALWIFVFLNVLHAVHSNMRDRAPLPNTFDPAGTPAAAP